MGALTMLTIVLGFALITPAVYFSAVDRFYERYAQPPSNTTFTTRLSRSSITLHGGFPTNNKQAYALCTPAYTQCAVFGIDPLPDRVEVQCFDATCRVNAEYDSSVMYWVFTVVVAVVCLLIGMVFAVFSINHQDISRVFREISQSPARSVAAVSQSMDIRYENYILTINACGKIVFCGRFDPDNRTPDSADVPKARKWMRWCTAMEQPVPENTQMYFWARDFTMARLSDGRLLVEIGPKDGWLQFKPCTH